MEQGAYFKYVRFSIPFSEAEIRLCSALQDESFAVITEIDFQEKIKAKLGVEFTPYLVLGACLPASAHKALRAEANIGLLLPCNALVKYISDDETEIAVIDPMISMQSVKNADLRCVADEVRAKLIKVMMRIEGTFEE